MIKCILVNDALRFHLNFVIQGKKEQVSEKEWELKLNKKKRNS